MPTQKEVRKLWEPAMVTHARAHGLRTVGGYAYLDQDDFVSVVALLPRATGDVVRVSWWVSTKPTALDDVLWAALMPDVHMGPAMRRNRRVNGAFAAPDLVLGRGELEVPNGDDPAPTITEVLGLFDDLRKEYFRASPTIEDFAERSQAESAGGIPRPQALLRDVLALMLAGQQGSALALLQAALARGERGPLSGPDGDVLRLLADYVRSGPPATRDH